MPVKHVLYAVLLSTNGFALSTYAATTQISAGIESSHFVDGLNLTDDQPSANLSIDVSFDQGLFLGSDCYHSEVDDGLGLERGCDYYLGYFRPISDTQAITASVTQHDYQRILNQEWDYTELSLDWHLSRRATLSVAATDDWFGRGFETVSLSGKFEHPLSKSFKAIIEGGVINLESRAPVNALEFGKLSLQHQKERWTSELSLILSDNDFRRMTRFDVDQPEVALSFSYRLY